jgi:hypothetical protein
MKRTIDWPNHLFNFVAVILGVYLAFYVNERAKINDDRKESIVLMSSLVNDLSEDINVYENYQIPANIKQHKDVEELIAMLIEKNFDGIGEQLRLVMQVENFAPTSSTYSSMKLSGKLRLIDDLSLRKNLTEYYDGMVAESSRKGEFQAEYFTKELLVWLTNNVDLIEMEILDKKDLTVLINHLIIYGSLIDQKVESYKSIVEDSKKLKESIETLIASS